MRKDNKPIDVEFENVKPDIYLTAPQVAQKIHDTDIRVRLWAEEFGDDTLLNIERTESGRKRYKESQVSDFAFIKDLIDNKNFSYEQVRKYCKKHGFKYAEYNSGLVNPKDPLGFEALASALTVKVDEKLNNFSEQLLSKIDERFKQYAILQHEENEKMREITMSILDGIVSDKLDISLKEFTNILQGKQDENTAQYNKLIDLLEKNLENQSAPKKESLFTKLFKKKK